MTRPPGTVSILAAKLRDIVATKAYQEASRWAADEGCKWIVAEFVASGLCQCRMYRLSGCYSRFIPSQRLGTSNDTLNNGELGNGEPSRSLSPCPRERSESFIPTWLSSNMEERIKWRGNR